MVLRYRTLLMLAGAFAAPAPSLADELAGNRLAEKPAPPHADADGDDLTRAFRSPPNSARPRVWWHWMNGNISREGIAADIAWMKRVGIGGLQNFDVDLSTGQVVDKRLVYMTAEWKDAFRFAASEASKAGLELAIASSPGWSATGGPWVRPEDGLKKLVWSEVTVAGGRAVQLTLAKPPSVAGPYQSMARQADVSDLLAGRIPEQGPEFYRDARVLAMPADIPAQLPRPVLTDAKGRLLANRDPAHTDGINVLLPSVVSGEASELRLDYGKPITVRAATLHVASGAVPLLGPLLSAVLESSEDGFNWKAAGPVPLEETPATISFPAITARYFRVVMGPGFGGGGEAKPDEGANPLAMENPFGKAIGQLLGKPVEIDLFQLHTEARVDRAEIKAGFAIAPDYFALPTVADAATGPDHLRVIDLTDRMAADGRLAWTPPPGSWKVIRLGYSLLGKTNHPAPAEATGLETDKFDRDATERYLEHYLGNYREAAGADLIGERGVQALLTDSIEVGAANWTPRLIEHFKRLRGYDPVPWLPAITGVLIGSRDDTDRFLFDYRRTLSDLIATEHYGTVARVAHRHGLKVYGEAIEGNRSTLGDDLATRRYADFPMAAMWTFDPAKGPQPSFVADIQGAASVAHVFGQNIVAAESMTATMAPWAFGPADLKHIIDLEFVLGVNRPVIHTSVHVPVEDRKPGLSLGGIGQFFNRNESWAELATPWVDYLSRNAWLLQQGRNFAEVAYFYGEEAPLSGLYGRALVADAPNANAFDFVNSDILHDALANEGSDLVTPGGARYRLLYLGGSSRRMSVGTLRRLVRLVEGGATVVGLAPTASTGLVDDPSEFAALVEKLWPGGADAQVGKGRVIASSDIGAALATMRIAADFAYQAASGDAEIAFNHRRLNDGDSYFLVNRRQRAETITARFKVTGKTPELWRAEDGSVKALGYRIHGDMTEIDFALAPGEAIHIVFRKPALAREVIFPAARSKPAAQVRSPWTLTFQAGRGAPDQPIMRKLAPLDTDPDPRVRYFSGIATYASTFDVDRSWRRDQPPVLDLGEAREVAEVRVNGALAGYAWHAPYTLDIGHLAHSGRNAIEVRVANLWVNRLIRDADPAVNPKISWASVATYKPTAPLRRSGLIGPVTITPPQGDDRALLVAG